MDHIDATQITQTSKMVSSYTGMIVQPNKAIVGANAFAHEAGIHQDGVLKNPLTYEIMTPESVGLNNTNLVLGKHSGRAAFNDRMQDLGFQVHSSSLPFLHLAGCSCSCCGVRMCLPASNCNDCCCCRACCVSSCAECTLPTLAAAGLAHRPSHTSPFPLTMVCCAAKSFSSMGIN